MRRGSTLWCSSIKPEGHAEQIHTPAVSLRTQAHQLG